MEKKDVPMDGSKYGDLAHKYYVPDENGDYVKVVSSGWEPLNIASDNFWESFSPDNEVLNSQSNYIWDSIMAKLLIEESAHKTREE